MRYILALDQGTTSSRAIVFDAEGRVRGVGQKEFRQIFPHNGWVEHDANELWSTQIGVAQEALANARIRADDVAAIGLTNQRETVVVWDRKTGKPVYNAVVWQDRRTAAYCDELKAAGHEALVRERTGLLIDPYFSGTKLRWLLDNVSGARERAEAGELAFGTVDSWLVYNLTGGELHVTEGIDVVDVDFSVGILCFSAGDKPVDVELGVACRYRANHADDVRRCELSGHHAVDVATLAGIDRVGEDVVLAEEVG